MRAKTQRPDIQPPPARYENSSDFDSNYSSDGPNQGHADAKLRVEDVDEVRFEESEVSPGSKQRQDLQALAKDKFISQLTPRKQHVSFPIKGNLQEVNYSSKASSRGG